MDIGQAEEEMVGQPERIEAGRFGQSGQSEELGSAGDIAGDLRRSPVGQVLWNGRPGWQEQPDFQWTGRRCSHGGSLHPEQRGEEWGGLYAN